MNGRSRSSLFLMEQLIVITIFALCSTVCVKIFVGSYLMANDTRDMNRALVAAKNAAECYKAYGDPAKAASVLGGQPPACGHPLQRRGQKPSQVSMGPGIVYYDSRWQVCGESGARYTLRLSPVSADEGESLPLLCEVSVSKVTGEEIIGFTVAASRSAAGRGAK